MFQVGIVVALNDVVDDTDPGPESKPRAVKSGRKSLPSR